MFLRLKPLLSILVLAAPTAYGLVQSEPIPLPKPTETNQSTVPESGQKNPNSSPAQAVPTSPAQASKPNVSANQPNLEAIVTNQNSQLSAQQARDLAKQTGNLSNEQLQAIAAALQNNPNQMMPEASAQIQAQPPATATPNAIASDLDSQKRLDAFNALMDEVLPLSPAQIEKLHKYYDLTQQAKSSSPTPPPSPNFTSIAVNLDPGSLPPVIRLSAGFVTSILFVDSTGAAWPITAYSIGDPSSFNIQWDQKGNALFIQSMKQYSHGNLAVRLWNLDTPVMVTLVSGQKNVDFRVDLQVAGRGPDAKPATVETTANAKVNPLLINILDGIPPRDSTKLSVTGGNGEAWFADGRIYFRTKLTVLSPAWTSKVASADGTHVYELMLTPSILASDNGRTVDIKLSGL